MTEEKFVDEYMRDWKNVMDDKGKVISFDRDEAIAMLKRNPAIYDAFKKVMDVEQCA